MVIESWIPFTRHRRDDEAKAFQTIVSRAEAELREAFADYDAFVPHARAVEDGIVLGTARSSTGEEFTIRLPWQGEYSHWLIQGGTGTGKTTWVRSILGQELRAHRPFGVLDCKGDLFAAMTEETSAYADSLEPAQRATFARSLVTVNPFSETLVPLNVCHPTAGTSPEVRAYEVTLALSRLFDSSLGLHMENILRHLILLLMEANLTLAEAPTVLQDEVLRGILAARSANPVIKNFFLAIYPVVPQVSKDALLSRLQSLLLPENVRLMLGADDLLDLRGVLERGDPLLVFMGKGPNVPEEQVEVLGSLFFQLLLQAAYSRGSGRHRGYLLAVDEFFHLLEAPGMSRRFEIALTSVRSFGLSLMLIHHNFAQLSPTLREIVLGNADFVALFRTSGRNADFFGDFLPEEPRLSHGEVPQAGSRRDKRKESENLQRLPDRHCYWYDRRKPHRAVKLRIPDFAPSRDSGRPLGTETRLHSRAELRAQIEARKKRLAELMRPPVRVTPTKKEVKETTDRPAQKPRRPKLG